MRCARLEERRELFILIVKSNRSDLGRKFRHKSLELSAICKTLLKVQSKVVNIGGARTSSRTLELSVVGTSDSCQNS